jgi:polyphosphate kinase 2 (PPK2 family)
MIFCGGCTKHAPWYVVRSDDKKKSPTQLHQTSAKYDFLRKSSI